MTAARLGAFVLLLAGCSGLPAPAPQPSLCAVRGTVKFNGVRPKAKMFRTGEVPGLPALGIPRDDLVVDAELNVRWAFVFIKKGLEGREYLPSSTPAVLEQSGFRYEPHVLGVEVGQRVEIVNRDPVLHCAHPILYVNPDYARPQPPVPPQPTVLQFRYPEVMIAVRCDIHPWMKAWIGVLPHPYFAVTDVEGKFEIKNLPPGKYTLGIWHESLKTLDGANEVVIEVKANQTVDFQMVKK